MTYTWGRKPPYTSQTEVGEGHVFGKGEYGLIKKHIFRSEEANSKEVLAQYTEVKVAQDYIAQIREGGGSVKYIRVSSKLYMMHLFWLKEFTIEECVIEGNAIPVVVILGILAIVGIILVLYRPLIFSLAGVKPIDVIVSDWGIVIIIGVILLLYFMSQSKGKG